MMRWATVGSRLKLCLVSLAVLACAVNIAHSARDVVVYGGTDLRARVVGARALLRQINPYTLQDRPELDPLLRDPDQLILSRCTYPPTLLLIYAIFAHLDYPVQRILWMVVEWLAFFISLGALALSLRSRRARFWFVVCMAGFVGGSYFWRLHVERGQYYVLLLACLSVGSLLTLRRRHPVAAGLCFGLAVWMRPTAILFLVPLWWSRSRKTVCWALMTLAVGLLGTTAVGGLGYWRDYLQLAGQWELALLDEPPDNALHAPPATGVVDGYRPTILPDCSANVSYASLVSGITARRGNPRLLSLVGKLLLLGALASILFLFRRGAALRPVTERYRLLAGALLMLMADCFVPIRIGYADVLYCLPLMLITPLLCQASNRVFVLALAIPFAISSIPFPGLPQSYWSILTALRTALVLYVVLRFFLLISLQRWRNVR